MLVTSQEFLPIYFTLLLCATIERISNTFFQKSTKIVGTIYYKWSFTVLFYSYIFIIIFSIVEYFIKVKLINMQILIIGVLFYVLGASMRRSAINALGENWSVYIEIKENHQLVTTGVYEKIKHPYCFAVLLELIGICLVSNAYIALILVFLIQLPLLILRIRLEEMILLTHFGDKYKSIK